MNTTIGTSQASFSVTPTQSTSSINYYISRWVSPLIYDTSVSANTWTWNFAAQEGSTNANWPVGAASQPVYVNCYVWKPSNGTKYGTILDGNTASTVSESSGTDERSHNTTFSGSAVSSLTAGDAVIIFEAWFQVAQAMNQSTTVQFYYDGTTVNTTELTLVSNHASFVESPQNFNFTPTGNNITRSLPTETVSISEFSLTLTRGKARSPAAQTVSISESPAVSRRTTKNRAPATETVSVSDSVIRVRGKPRAPATETVTISEVSLTRRTAKIRTISQSTTISESLTRLASKQRALATETTTIGGGTVARIKGAIKPISQSITIGENLARLCNKIRTRTETVTISDSLTRLAAKNRSLATQTVTISDSVARIVARAVAKSLTETVTIGESLVRRCNKIRTKTETVTIGEAVARQSAKIRIIPTQSTSISDSVVKVRGRVKALATETVTIGESLVRQCAKIRTISQTTAISESISFTKSGVRNVVKTLTETVTIGEAVTRRLGKQRSIPTQSTSISDSLNRTANKIRTISQTITISDAVTRVKARNIIKSITETVTIGAGTVVRLCKKTRSLTETVTISDVLTYFSSAKAPATTSAKQQVAILVQNLKRQQIGLAKAVERTLYETTPITDAVKCEVIRWSLLPKIRLERLAKFIKIVDFIDQLSNDDKRRLLD